MPRPRLALAALAGAIMLAAPATAAAAPPPNDNYLASTTIQNQSGGMPLEYRDRVDTTEATTQADTFDPNRDGLPFGGGDPEPTSCGPNGPSYGRTAWWDFRPPSPGGVEINVDGTGFDAVVAVYTWSASTSKITRTVLCQRAQSGDIVIPDVRRGTNYTVQVGGVNDTGGPVSFSLDWFPDRDGDDILDALDECDRRKGIQAAGGCPPELRSAARFRYDGVGGGAIRITSMAIDGVPKGARGEVRCRRCGPAVSRKAKRSGVLQLRGFVGRVLRPGDRIEVRVTQGRTGKGRYRFGAVGKYFRWPVVAGGVGDRVVRCLQPGSRRPTRCR
jgi:hypothetical protein